MVFFSMKERSDNRSDDPGSDDGGDDGEEKGHGLLSPVNMRSARMGLDSSLHRLERP